MVYGLGVDVERKKLQKLFKHPIISAVIAGLILMFLAWAGGFIPSAITIAKRVFLAVWSVVTYRLPLPLWLVFLISMPLFGWIVRVSQSLTATSSEAVVVDKEAGLSLKRKKIELTLEENEVMTLFVKADGRSLQVDDIKYSLNFTVLEISQILEALEEKQLIVFQSNYMYGKSFSLTQKGRDHMIGNKFVST